MKRFMASIYSLFPSTQRPEPRTPMTQELLLRVLDPSAMRAEAPSDAVQFNAAYSFALGGFMRMGELTYSALEELRLTIRCPTMSELAHAHEPAQCERIGGVELHRVRGHGTRAKNAQQQFLGHRSAWLGALGGWEKAIYTGHKSLHVVVIEVCEGTFEIHVDRPQGEQVCAYFGRVDLHMLSDDPVVPAEGASDEPTAEEVEEGRPWCSAEVGVECFE
ncbi:hypothetical protein E4U59_000987 [Claviceps monticola]|nr:hypothetical protein E4U59_000987 [Claviceps monticola]